jgi:hypothetical protein
MSTRIFKIAITAMCAMGVSVLAKGDESPAPQTTGGTVAPGVRSAEPSPSPQAQRKESTPASAEQPAHPKSKHPPFSEVIGDTPAIEGLINLYRKETRLFAELTPNDLNKDFILGISVARGIAENQILGGMMLGGMGDDWIWQFRKVDDRIQVVRRNVRFRANKGTPTEKAVYFAYTDSVLYSLPIATQSPGGGMIVELNPVFMSDLAQLSGVMKGFMFAPDRSTWAYIKNYKDNTEIEVAATYASAGQAQLDTVPDSRGATINIHYSLSRLPETGYQPRQADDRVGYFLAVVKDFSKQGENDQFVRHINRWDLRKAEPTAAVSPPVKPIIFWIEKTVPYKYRGAIREGILEWNKAFEKAGFSNAIEVRQQPDDATWDPEDINYNSFRWITSNAGFAMGPSRVNPITGQILNASIIFDADFVESWLKRFEVTPPPMNAMDRRAARAFATDSPGLAEFPPIPRESRYFPCECGHGMSEQLALGAVAVASVKKSPAAKEKLDRLIYEGIKSVAMHEVGHTLGLRHNFKASTYLTLEDANNPQKTRSMGMAASVMDYLPMNLVPKGQKQGDYFDLAIGPYDYWAIEYGYKPLPGGSEGEVPELKKIAARGGEPGLDFSTDEDTRESDSDPHSNRFDLGKDPIAFAQQRAEVIRQLLPTLTETMVEPGEGYQNVRRSFGMLMREYNSAMGFVARNVGGIYIHRDHKGDPEARPPFVPVEAKKQRESLHYLATNVFGPKAYQFSPQLYGYLAGENWMHWGVTLPNRKEIALPDLILSWQEQILGRLLSPLTLSRIADTEFKTPPEQDAFTNKELLTGLTAAIFQELDNPQLIQGGKFTDRAPAIGTVRRNLQHKYFEQLAELAMGDSGEGGGITLVIGRMRGGGESSAKVPTECRTVAASELEGLRKRIDKVLAGKAELDSYTRFHLVEIARRIQKVLDARLSLRSP